MLTYRRQSRLTSQAPGSRCRVKQRHKHADHKQNTAHGDRIGLETTKKADQNWCSPARETSASVTKLSVVVLMVAKASLTPSRVGSLHKPAEVMRCLYRERLAAELQQSSCDNGRVCLVGSQTERDVDRTDDGRVRSKKMYNEYHAQRYSAKNVDSSVGQRVFQE